MLFAGPSAAAKRRIGSAPPPNSRLRRVRPKRCSTRRSAGAKERLAGLVNALPAEQRDALRLAYFEGRTYRQVAAELGIPEGTAKSRLRIALARLREKLENDDRWAWT